VVNGTIIRTSLALRFASPDFRAVLQVIPTGSARIVIFGTNLPVPSLWINLSTAIEKRSSKTTNSRVAFFDCAGDGDHWFAPAESIMEDVQMKTNHCALRAALISAAVFAYAAGGPYAENIFKC
jgi:hypothetical protein